MKINKIVTLAIIVCLVLATVLMIVGYVHDFGTGVTLSQLGGNLFDYQKVRTTLGSAFTTGLNERLDIALAGFAFFIVAGALLLVRGAIAMRNIKMGNTQY